MQTAQRLNKKETIDGRLAHKGHRTFGVDESGTLQVHLHVLIDVVVINKSSVKIDNAEGQEIASKLQKKAVQIPYGSQKTGVLFPDNQLIHFLSWVSKGDKVKKINYTLSLEQKFRYVNEISENNKNDEILVLVDKHLSSINEKVDAAGRANYDLGAATVNIMDVIGGVFIKSSSKMTNDSNTGNHEVGHLLGLKDRYEFNKQGKLIRNEQNLMGAGNYFNLTSIQIDEMAKNALTEIGITWMKTKNKWSPSEMSNKMSDYGHGGIRTDPNYKLSPKERVNKSIQRNNALVK